MKKLLAVSTVLTLLVIMTLTPSLYVEGIEIPAIIIGTAILALLLKFPEDRNEKFLAHSMRVFDGFAFGWIFSAFDLLLDHLLYFQQTGFEDGAYLTLSFKFDEFANGFFLLSLYCMAAVAFFIVIQSIFKFIKKPKKTNNLSK